MAFAAQHIKTGRLHLQKADPVMKRILKKVGPFTAKTRRDRFLTLVRSILSQQISGAAARTIQQRLVDALHPQKITAESLVDLKPDELRTLGISRQKASYLLDLARHVHAGTVDLSRLGRHSESEIVSTLTQVKGIGVWTAQMFMMFSLGRLDVFPVDDLGIQNAIKKNYEIEGPLTKTELLEIAEPWRPYTTIASWYLWRSLEIDE